MKNTTTRTTKILRMASLYVLVLGGGRSGREAPLSLFCQAVLPPPSKGPSSSSVTSSLAPSSSIGSDSDSDDQRTTSVLKTIQNNPEMEVFRLLCKHVGLNRLLNRQHQREPELLVFAPLKVAFEKFAKNDLDYLKMLLTEEQLYWHVNQLVNNHIVASTATGTRTGAGAGAATTEMASSPSVMLSNLTTPITVTMRSGETLTIGSASGSDSNPLTLQTAAASLEYTTETANATAITTTSDGILATNGVVYEIHTILYPVWYYQDDVLHILEQETSATPPLPAAAASNFSILLSLINRTHLIDEFQSETMSTLLAPNNEAFEKSLSESELEYLSDNVDALREVLTYHVLSGVVVTQYTFDDQSNKRNATTAGDSNNSSTSFVAASRQGENVRITRTTTTTAIDGEAGEEFHVRFQESRATKVWLTKSCIVYQVDRVLLPRSLYLPPPRS